MVRAHLAGGSLLLPSLLPGFLRQFSVDGHLMKKGKNCCGSRGGYILCKNNMPFCPELLASHFVFRAATHKALPVSWYRSKLVFGITQGWPKRCLLFLSSPKLDIFCHVIKSSTVLCVDDLINKYYYKKADLASCP